MGQSIWPLTPYGASVVPDANDLLTYPLPTQRRMKCQALEIVLTFANRGEHFGGVFALKAVVFG